MSITVKYFTDEEIAEQVKRGETPHEKDAIPVAFAPVESRKLKVESRKKPNVTALTNRQTSAIIKATPVRRRQIEENSRNFLANHGGGFGLAVPSIPFSERSMVSLFINCAVRSA